MKNKKFACSLDAYSKAKRLGALQHTFSDAEEVKTEKLMMKKVATRLCELIMMVGNELFT